MSETYTLYGSHASYLTACSRSYLRKKGIPFVERLPAAPRFREHVRPSSGSHRIPQLETPDGEVIQDSTAIFDFLEARFPDPPAQPEGVRQQLASRWCEVLIDAVLGMVAWHYRWNFMDENYGFVGREFGRSFKPQGTDDEIDHYGRLIADRMEGKRKAIGVTREHFPALEALYFDVLDALEAHFTRAPYLFGGLPSLADHVLMGPIFGHLARDPLPAFLMKQRAPRVFRWAEAMNTPELQAPEFADFAPAWFPDDEIPETLAVFLRLLISEAKPQLLETARCFAEWVEAHPDHPAGTAISEKMDEPSVGRFERDLRGTSLQTSAQAYSLWVLQRGFDWFDTLSAEDQEKGRAFLSSLGGEALLEVRPARRLTRVNNFVAVA
ncbi:MAG: glutathione S-transferase family protein [Myxococcota bacterium]